MFKFYFIYFYLIVLFFFNLFFISAKQAINQGRSPVIIDNTNTQAWEMKPYVEMVNMRYERVFLFFSVFSYSEISVTLMFTIKTFVLVL